MQETMGATQGHTPAPKQDGQQVMKRRVKLAASPIGLPMPEMLQAYHTSVIVDDVEFSFSGRGIDQLQGIASHVPFSGRPMVIDMGYTKMSRTAMIKYLHPHFMPGTYDLLRKNCNSFSDCALSFLLGQRLEEKYRSMEKIGALTDKHAGVVRIFTGGGYQPNPRVDGWQSGQVVEKIDKQVVRPR